MKPFVVQKLTTGLYIYKAIISIQEHKGRHLPRVLVAMSATLWNASRNDEAAVTVDLSDSKTLKGMYKCTTWQYNSDKEKMRKFKLQKVSSSNTYTWDFIEKNHGTTRVNRPLRLALNTTKRTYQIYIDLHEDTHNNSKMEIFAI